MQQTIASSVRRTLAVIALALLFADVAFVANLSAQVPPALTEESPQQLAVNRWADISEAMVRLPVAAVLGTALALRVKRRGTPKRTPVVVQTQIILAVVGAIIMLVVGASLARAFGIVGAANLIRYRSKIDDPKDAGVMLCCLAVGLAAGVGLYALAVFSTVFLVGVLAIIESFEPTTSQKFELKITVSDDAADVRPRIERVLDRFAIEYSVRAASSAELSYDVKVPFEVETDRVTNAMLTLGDDDKIAVEWDEKGKKK